MKKKIGIVCMILGTVLIALALSLFIYNSHQARSAKKASREALTLLVGQMEIQEEAVEGNLLIKDEGENDLQIHMPTLEVDGNEYVGVISLPSLGLELPVLAQWNYDLLRLAPCLYSGTTFTNNMVLMAHNYESHFGKIDELAVGDLVLFTDISGGTLKYEVAAKDVLPASAVEDMTEGTYDLTLFTCTYGGAERVTIRCSYEKE